MKYLFIHQNFPGQYLHIVRHLVQNDNNEVVFISEDNQNVIKGVRRVRYRMPRGAAVQAHLAVRELDMGMVRASEVERAARTLKNLGFHPDIIIGHHGWGELLNIQDVYPDVPVLGYFEFYYHTEPGFDVGFDPEFPLQPQMLPIVRAKNAINLLALTAPGYGQTPTDFQKSAYPAWAADKISVLREGVDLDACKPDPKLAKKTFNLGDIKITPKNKLITYVSRDLEPYRGFHVFMRALPRILEEEPNAHVIMVGGDGVSYGAPLASGCWREKMLQELEGQLDLSRVHFVGKVDYRDFLRLLQRSDAHVYLTYPFVASWSLREAMAIGCAIVGSATAPVQEFLTDQETAILVPFTEPDKIASGVLELLRNKPLATRLRRAVREKAEHTLCIKAYLAEYENLIEHVIATHKAKVQLPRQNAVEVEEKPAKTVTKPVKRRVTTRKTEGKTGTARGSKKVVPFPAPKAVRSPVQKTSAKSRKSVSARKTQG
ncbi:glycosyl transferase [Acetobacter pomorum]|uniref:Glycosyl transferase n=1 Tax=Acetobacter pomorum TaxID=65959 RepID=A0A2G4RF16_9PROT|nr:glycosyltransferase family 4 protein [Acetobacter pomorum]PHY95137.1 glycosyl transferase [Acetobacter pomorum]GBR49689.1 glycosyltransferase [Acetobacter pomorum DSM 11825]